LSDSEQKIVQKLRLNTPRSRINIIGDGANNADGAQGLVIEHNAAQTTSNRARAPVPPPGYVPGFMLISMNCENYNNEIYDHQFSYQACESYVH